MTTRGAAPVLVVAACAALLAGCGSALPPAQRTATLPTVDGSRPSSAPRSPARPEQPGRAYAVAAPLIVPVHGPAPPQRPPCTAREVTATARTTRGGGGVLGVVTLAGVGCRLTVDPAGLRLLDAQGHPAATVGKALPLNPGHAGRPDIDEANGSAKVGFAWTGSYCGSPPVTVEVPALPGPVRAPVHGPLPACDHASGASGGTVLAGDVAGVDGPLEPAPAAWRGLRARLLLPRTVGPGPLPLTVTLVNVTGSAISLSDPCPADTVNVVVPTADGGRVEQTELAGYDLCDRGSLVVPARGSVTVPVTAPLADGPRQQPRASRLIVDWAIAGVRTAHATALVR